MYILLQIFSFNMDIYDEGILNCCIGHSWPVFCKIPSIKLSLVPADLTAVLTHPSNPFRILDLTFSSSLLKKSNNPM